MKRLFLAALVTLAAGSPALAATIAYRLTELAESVRPEGDSIAEAQVSVASEMGRFETGDPERLLATGETETRAAPRPGDALLNNARARVAYAFENLTGKPIEIELSFVGSGVLSSEMFDADASLQLGVGLERFNGDVYAFLSQTRVGDGLGATEATVMESRSFLIPLAPGAVAERFFEVLSTADAADTPGVAFESNSEGRFSISIASVTATGGHVTPVPLPAGLPLAMGALGLLALVRHSGRRA